MFRSLGFIFFRRKVVLVGVSFEDDEEGSFGR